MESGACAQQGGGGKQPGKQRRGEVGRLDEYNRALNAVTTALVGGVAGQGAGQVASNALAAYAAYFIGSKLDPNHGSDPNATLQLLSHAILGALLAEANGGNAGTGALSAAGGELAAKVLTNTLTGGDPSKLSPEQKEVVLALSQVVGALAGGLLGWCLGWRNTSGHASCRQESFGNGGVGSCLCNAQHASTLGGQVRKQFPQPIKLDPLHGMWWSCGRLGPKSTRSRSGVTKDPAAVGRGVPQPKLVTLWENLLLTDVKFSKDQSRYSADQTQTDVSVGDAIGALYGNEYSTAVSKDGAVVVLQKGNNIYRTYPSSSSDAVPSASLTISDRKQPVLKIGFVGNENGK
ncbi:VENN motif pre-toxin domain-containing protein [Stenotrophomonas sp. BSUC-16]|uniref:VENN motif pre-toxin domain-containing protein n=1 Tax=Stenotrophomonas TaxID=40323 RepID=UPI001D112083|nr:VENN motif pre-toxin domain-containing protein [Stenotrophomonas maltophilia]MCO5734948.1 VENN motif pre-toxin domain-containing protein [Stenotrophomonas maltophilia]UXB36326.1 VENN motif pre-toxin domain-containing protein [Stenotrophomonas maltophilia]